MNKLPVLTFLFFAAVFAGCNNDLDLTAPAQDIPVVYGIFSKQNSDHYIRVERGFIDDNINAETLAQDPNNLTYDDAVVKVNINGTPFILERVNGNDEGLPRDNGFFANDPNYLYKLENVNLINSSVVDVIIDRGPGFDEVTTRNPIPVIDNFTLRSPNPLQGGTVGIRTDETRFTLRYDAPNEAKIFDAFLTFHYRETTNSGGMSEDKSFTWTVARNQIRPTTGDTDLTISAKEGRDFFNTLIQEVPERSGVTRTFQKFSVEISAGGQAFADYISLTQANTGITSSQEVPNFSNLTEGLGLVSSKFTLKVDSLDISTSTLQEIRNGELTSGLGFN